MTIRRLLLGTIAVAGLSMGGAFASGMGLQDDLSPCLGTVNIADVFGFNPEDLMLDNNEPRVLDEGYGDSFVLSAIDDFGTPLELWDEIPHWLDVPDSTMTRTPPTRFDQADADLTVFGFDINRLDLGTQKHYGLGGTNAGVAPLAS